MVATWQVVLYARSKVTWPGPVHERLLDYVMANETENRYVLPSLSQCATQQETGISPTIARERFAELVAWRVLERIEGAGSRGHAYRVNLRFDEWLVPWLGATAPGMDDAPSREWSTRRHLALAEIDRFARPPAVHETLVVARPGARQTNGHAAPHTILPIKEPHSLTPTAQEEGGSEESDLVLATISTRAGAPIFGAPAKRVRYIAEGAGDVHDLVDAVHRAPPGLSVTAYVEIVSQAYARRRLGDLEPTRPQIPEWREPELVDEPPAADARAQIEAARAGLRSPAGGAATCETDTGGAP